MSIEAIIADWGVPAVFAGAAFEGETAVIAGGLIAHQGLASWPAVYAAAALGSFTTDQLFFALGRRFRDTARVRRTMERPAFARAAGWLERWPIGFIFAFRFLYGLRTVSPIAIGTSRVPATTFLMVNAAAALVWAAVFVTLGYWFGEAVTDAFGRLRPSRHTLIVAALALGFAFVTFQLGRWIGPWRSK